MHIFASFKTLKIGIIIADSSLGEAVLLVPFCTTGRDNSTQKKSTYAALRLIETTEYPIGGLEEYRASY